MKHQPTNKEDAEAGNIDAVRHVSYAEGYKDGKAFKRDFLQEQIRLKLAQAQYWMDNYRKNGDKVSAAYSLGQLQALEQIHFMLYGQGLTDAKQLLDWYHELAN